MQRTLLSTWKRPASLLALGLALAILMGWGGLSSQPVAATNASVDFSMNVVSGGTPAGGSGCSTNNDPPPTAKGSAVCSVAGGGLFVVEVQVIDIGVVGTDFIYPGAFGVHTVIDWTPGLTGPGDPSSVKAVSAVNCPLTSSTSAPFNAQPQTARASCSGSLSEAQAEGFIGRFELTCGTSTSQELVTMTLAAPKSDGTHIPWFYGTIADANSSEVITIECGGAPPTPTPTAAPQPSPTPTTFGPTVPPPPPGVGGVGFAPDLGGLALETSGSSSGGSAGLLIAISALAAGFVMLGAGVWYARRRPAFDS